MRARVTFVVVVWLFGLTIVRAADHSGEAKTAGLTETDVAALKQKIAELSFPVPEFTIEDMLPVLVESHSIAYADGDGQVT